MKRAATHLKVAPLRMSRCRNHSATQYFCTAPSACPKARPDSAMGSRMEVSPAAEKGGALPRSQALIW